MLASIPAHPCRCERAFLHLRRCWLRNENARRREPSGARAFSVNFSATYDPVGRRTLAARPHYTTGWYREISILEKNFSGKPDANVYRLRENRRQVPLPDKGMGDGGTTFTISADFVA